MYGSFSKGFVLVKKLHEIEILSAELCRCLAINQLSSIIRTSCDRGMEIGEGGGKSKHEYVFLLISHIINAHNG